MIRSAWKRGSKPKALGSIALPTSAAIVVAMLWPRFTGRIFAVWTLFALAYVLVTLHRQIGRLIFRSQFDDLMNRPALKNERPEGLRRTERLFGWKAYSARDFDYDVRPVLRDLIERRVRNRANFEIPARPAGNAALDPELAALIGPKPGDELYPDAVRTSDLARIVGKLEQMQ